MVTARRSKGARYGNRLAYGNGLACPKGPSRQQRGVLKGPAMVTAWRSQGALYGKKLLFSRGPLW
jgi:hypothetical protein